MNAKTTSRAEQVANGIAEVIAEVARASAARKGASPVDELDAATAWVLEVICEHSREACRNAAWALLAAGAEAPAAA